MDLDSGGLRGAGGGAVGPHVRDHALDRGGVERAVEWSFPDLRPARAEPFGAGWDNEVYLVNGEWLFRFPKRFDVADALEPERSVLPLVADHVPFAVPRFERVAGGNPHFPHPFVGYRPVPGVSGDALPDTLPDDAERRLAAGIGRALAALHAVPVARARALGAPERAFVPGARLAEARRAVAALRPVVAREALDPWVAVVEGAAAAPPAASSPERLVHGDLASEHLLFDAGTLALTGMIDFADLAIGDPAMDLVGPYHWRGERFVRLVLEAYGEADAGMLARARFEAVVSSGVWLAEAMAWDPPEGVARHRRRFERIIAPVAREMARGG